MNEDTRGYTSAKDALDAVQQMQPNKSVAYKIFYRAVLSEMWNTGSCGILLYRLAEMVKYYRKSRPYPFNCFEFQVYWDLYDIYQKTGALPTKEETVDIRYTIPPIHENNYLSGPSWDSSWEMIWKLLAVAAAAARKRLSQQGDADDERSGSPAQANLSSDTQADPRGRPADRQADADEQRADLENNTGKTKNVIGTGKEDEARDQTKADVKAIRDQAEQDAKQIRDQAKAEAKAIRDQAEQDAKQIRDQAKQIRDQADKAAEETKATAQKEANKLVDDARDKQRRISEEDARELTSKYMSAGMNDNWAELRKEIEKEDQEHAAALTRGEEDRETIWRRVSNTQGDLVKKMEEAVDRITALKQEMCRELGDWRNSLSANEFFDMAKVYTGLLRLHENLNGLLAAVSTAEMPEKEKTQIPGEINTTIYRMGIIERQMDRALRAFGMHPIRPEEGELFDSYSHELSDGPENENVDSGEGCRIKRCVSPGVAREYKDPGRDEQIILKAKVVVDPQNRD